MKDKNQLCHYFKKEFTIANESIFFSFKLAYYGSEPIYHIAYSLNGRIETFRMNRDEDGHWKIMAQVLPQEVHDLDLEFSDAIEDCETE